MPSRAIAMPQSAQASGCWSAVSQNNTLWRAGRPRKVASQGGRAGWRLGDQGSLGGLGWCRVIGAGHTPCRGQGRQAVQQQAVRLVHPVQLDSAELGQAGCAKQAPASGQVNHRQRDAVADLWCLGMGQVRRLPGLGGHGGELQRGQAIHPERGHPPVTCHRHHPPVHTTVVLQDPQHRQCGGELLKHGGGDVKVNRRAVAQAQQAANMVHLGVSQHHGADLGVLQAGVVLQCGVAVQLVGHGG